MDNLMLKENHLKLFNVVDTILCTEWDPIGISDIPGAPSDEYRAYVPQIVSLLVQSASRDEIAARLNSIAQDKIGMGGNINHCLTIADKLILSCQSILR